MAEWTVLQPCRCRRVAAGRNEEGGGSAGKQWRQGEGGRDVRVRALLQQQFRCVLRGSADLRETAAATLPRVSLDDEKVWCVSVRGNSKCGGAGRRGGGRTKESESARLQLVRSLGIEYVIWWR